MSRPQGVHAGSSAGNRIDASLCAYAGTTIERRYSLSDLPRLQEAGACEGSVVDVVFGFSQFEGRVAIDGTLDGHVALKCQRCLKPVNVPLHDTFKIIVVRDEAELDQEPGGYEAVLGDPARLDLLTLVEDQVLLALPLVPRHDVEQCPGELAGQVQPAAVAEVETQRPFGDLRDLMRKR